MKKVSFGLPENVIFCKNCVESNQRFMSSVQHLITDKEKKSTVEFDEDGICLACKYAEKKRSVNWKKKETEFLSILDRYRKNNGEYDVLVPGSGGKDSIYTSIILRDKYKMNPLTCTWSPGIYTDIGLKNYNSWIECGFDNIFFNQNKKVHALLTKLAFLNLLHPFQPFVLGQYSFPIKVAIEKKIKLIIYGDGQEERAVNKDSRPIHGKKTREFPKTHYLEKNNPIYLAGLKVNQLINNYSIKKSDLNAYLPVDQSIIKKNKIELLSITNYLNCNPQEKFYFAKENSKFEVNPDGRSEGTYTKYSSLDDKLDGWHYYTWYIKTGRGRTTEDASIEIRNNIITREDGMLLVKKFDGEFPKKYFNDCLKYTGISNNSFFKTINKFRPKHLWKKHKNKWVLKKAVWNDLSN